MKNIQLKKYDINIRNDRFFYEKHGGDELGCIFSRADVYIPGMSRLFCVYKESFDGIHLRDGYDFNSSAGLISTFISTSVCCDKVIYARYCLGAYYFRSGLLDKSLEVICPALDKECDNKWILILLMARIYIRKRQFVYFDQAVSDLVISSPEGVFDSVKKTTELIKNYDSF